MDAPTGYEDDTTQANLTHDIEDPSTETETTVLGRELDAQIQAAMTQLAEPFRTLIVLREVQGLSYEEIASLTHTNLGTVKSRLARARLKLQEMLAPYLHEPPNKSTP
jgi:RNA polymerase sigma-70 factor (ECF subfamily)